MNEQMKLLDKYLFAIIKYVLFILLENPTSLTIAQHWIEAVFLVFPLLSSRNYSLP